MGRIYDATWGRFFSAVYDSLMKSTEEAGMREIRRETLAAARGRTIDIGAGTGINVELYPEAVTELVLAEPDEHMLNRLRPKVPGWGREVSVVQAGAGSLPFDDDSFDTAVFTLVLCTVPDPRAALDDAARVLKPGGKLLFVEHVRSAEPGLARWQDRLEGPWRFLGDGCHCNRDTVATIEASPFTVERVERGELPKSPPLVRPLVHGQATLAA
ncbi:MAG TPA: class I SAM-dependent methyltransferase [Solirubrobacterales bacterium]|nr:class I SAM-dependent methyltransferase [Solirubrobacterales bacterium]